MFHVLLHEVPISSHHHIDDALEAMRKAGRGAAVWRADGKLMAQMPRWAEMRVAA